MSTSYPGLGILEQAGGSGLLPHVGWAKEGHHVEEGELVLADQIRHRERVI